MAVPALFAVALRNRWHMLIGNPIGFSLEARVFHSITLGGALLTCVYVPYNLFAGLRVAALSCVVFGGFFFYEYYRSRFLLREYRSLPFGITGLLLLSINYFANAGIEGSTDLIWPAYLLFLLAICPYRSMLWWVVIYLVVFGVVHLVEHRFPALVHYPFRVGEGRLTDRITAFPIPAISIAIIIGFFRRNYDRERAAVVQRDQEKGRLLSILSHDLRVPFIQVQQYLEVLGEDGLSPADRAGIERALKKKNDQTLDLVTNLLYWSRSQLDGFSMRLTSLPLEATLKNTIELAMELSSEKGVSFASTIPSEIRVIGDADMLQVVVRNLLQNAIKFTASAGTVRIVAGTTADRCRITVTDDGIGIKPAQLEQIFSGNISAFGTANEKGVGVGLKLCKEFTERQGGSIAVESILGQGSRFTVTLPLVKTSA